MSTTSETLPKCEYCGQSPHHGLCPRIKRIEYSYDAAGARRTAAVDLTDPRLDRAVEKLESRLADLAERALRMRGE